jgi:hypothetical protein
MKEGFKVEVRGLKDAVEVSRLQVFPYFEATASGPLLPCIVELRLVLKGGTFVVDEFRARRKRGGVPIRTELLRKIPVGQIVRMAVEEMITLGQTPAEREQSIRPQDLGDAEKVRHVADTYRLGVLIGQSPTQLVAEHLGMSRAAAGRWISRAREEGFLGPALLTKAGEADG